MAAQPLDAPRLAQEVQKLRSEWKVLDQQHAGVPKALWERFDSACERAYAPAARHFAQVAAQRKEARRQREDFIAAAAAQSPTLPGEPPDWRAIERFLRDTDRAWREGDLGSVEPGAWKKLDARLRAALAPLRDALSSAREQAKAGRLALIAEATALASKAMERDVPSQVKAIQAPMAGAGQGDAAGAARRARAVGAVSRRLRRRVRRAPEQAQGRRRPQARRTRARSRRSAPRSSSSRARTKATNRRSGGPCAICRSSGRGATGGREGAAAGLESRFRSAKTAVEAAIAARTRSREAAVWQTLAAKERLCEELDSARARPRARLKARRRRRRPPAMGGTAPSLPAAWESQMVARRDAALRVRADAAASADYRPGSKQASRPAAPRCSNSRWCWAWKARRNFRRSGWRSR